MKGVAGRSKYFSKLIYSRRVMSTEIVRETDSLLKDETKSYTYKGSVDTALSYELPPSKPHSKPRRALTYVGKSILSVLGIKTKGNNNGEFTSSIGVMLSMMGCVIGTGNIWRFPRIMATHADEGGALVFIIVWCLFLFLWSIPICLIEYGIGRYTKKSVVESFHIMIGPSYRWMGAFITIVTLAIGSFYSVLLGYCAYYSVFFLFTELPSEFEVSNGHFQYLIDSPFPIICHIICIALACLALSRGVSTIEPVNRVIVPTLLFIVVFTFYWALTLPYAGMGIIHMFTPSWETFGDAQLWRDALTQNAWDTGAGGALFLTYATYMKREQGAVKLGSTTPIINNLVSLICGITIFCNVFSFEYLHASPINEIIDKLKNNGPYNTGITFIQMPILYGSIAGGRVLAILFFFCITLAGLSSLISILELCVHVLEDFGVKRLLATSIIFVLSLSLGLASALSNEVFTNQDAVWSQGLIVSGCMLIFLVIRFGIFKFRRDVVNNYGIRDWPLPYLWVIVILFICPIEGFGMLVWWFVDEIVNNPDNWWQLSTTSLFMVLTQWIIVVCISIGLNWWLSPITRVETITLSTRTPKRGWERVKNSIIRCMIIHKEIHLPMEIEKDPPTTGSSTGESGFTEVSDQYKLKGSKNEILKVEEIKDEQL